MIRIKVTKRPNLTLKLPGRAVFMGIGQTARKSMRQRTETKRVDFQGRKFRKYSPGYEKYRLKKGRSTQPNLSFTGKMLGSIQVLARPKGVTLHLSGQEGLKAWANEQGKRSRIFFYLSRMEKDRIVKTVVDWTTRRNRLK